MTSKYGDNMITGNHLRQIKAFKILALTASFGSCLGTGVVSGYSRTTVARTLMARLPRLFRTRS